jgi:hypothetical protein
MSKEPDYTAHQFNLFPFQPDKLKVKEKKKISTERIRAAQEELAKGKAGNTKTIVQGLRDLGDVLERWENRIKTK